MEHSEKNTGKWTLFFLVAVGIYMSTLDGSIVNIALPAIMNDFGTSIKTVGWVVMIYQLTVSALLLGFGRLSDIRGRRWVYCRGLVVFAAGSFFCAIAPNIALLIAARSIQGVGAAMIMACTPAIVVETFPMRERGKALGMVGAVVAAGLTSGPPLGGWITQMFSWHYIFYINIPIGLGAAIFAARLLKGGKSDVAKPESFDRAGAFLLALFMCAFIFAGSHAHEWGVASFKTAGLFLVSIVAAIALVRLESAISHPVIQPSLLKIRLFTLPLASAVIMFAALFTMVFLMPFYLMRPCGFTAANAGYLMLTPFVFLFFVSPVSGILSDRIGSRFLCTAGLVILSMGLLALAFLPPRGTHPAIVWRLALTGIGTAVFISPNSSITMTAVPPAYKGVAAGTVATARNLGMVLGIAFAETVFNTVFQSESGGVGLTVYGPEFQRPFMAAFRHTMIAGAILAGIGAVVAFLRGPERRNNKCEPAILK